MFSISAVKTIARRIYTNFKLNASGEKALLQKHLDSIHDSSLQKVFTEASSIFNNEILSKRKLFYSKVEDVIQKLQTCPDKKVRELAEKIMQETRGKSNQEIFNSLHKAESLLDSVNVAEKKYCTLYNIDYPMENLTFNKSTIQELTKTLNDAIKTNNKEGAEKIAKKLYRNYSQPRQAYLALKRGGRADEITSPEFELSSRFSCMRDFILYYPEESKMANHLYKYFINEVKNTKNNLHSSERENISGLLKTINKKFNTKVFLDEIYYSTINALEELKDELNIWKKISKGKSRFPRVYESNRYANAGMINGNTGGDSRFDIQRLRTEDIVLSGETIGDNLNRHEMVHLNDTRFGVDLGKKIQIPDWQKNEMKKAGISTDMIEYAETDLREKAAVVLSGDISSCTQKFKNDMVKIDGIEQYMTKLCSHSEFFERALKRKYTNPEAHKTIEKIKELFDGKVPLDVSKAMLKDKTLLSVADDVIKEQKRKYEYGFQFISDCEMKYEDILYTKQKLEQEAIWAQAVKAKTEYEKFMEESETLHKKIQEEIEFLRASRENGLNSIEI